MLLTISIGTPFVIDRTVRGVPPKGTTLIVLDASPKPGYVNSPIAITGAMYGSWGPIKDGLVLDKPISITTSWGFTTIVKTGSYHQQHQGKFSVITTCPSTPGTYTITATFYEDEELTGTTTTISYQVLSTSGPDSPH